MSSMRLAEADEHGGGAERAAVRRPARSTAGSSVTRSPPSMATSAAPTRPVDGVGVAQRHRLRARRPRGPPREQQQSARRRRPQQVHQRPTQVELATMPPAAAGERARPPWPCAPGGSRQRDVAASWASSTRSSLVQPRPPSASGTRQRQTPMASRLSHSAAVDLASRRVPRGADRAGVTSLASRSRTASRNSTWSSVNVKSIPHLGIPSMRSAMMLRWISLVPA